MTATGEDLVTTFFCGCAPELDQVSGSCLCSDVQLTLESLNVETFSPDEQKPAVGERGQEKNKRRKPSAPE